MQPLNNAWSWATVHLTMLHTVIHSHSVQTTSYTDHKNVDCNTVARFCDFHSVIVSSCSRKFMHFKNKLSQMTNYLGI